MERKKKIVLIGPVYPYKGGISHYTGLMYHQLDSKHNVIMISYKMQYPKFMFHKEQKDYENDSFKVENTQYMLHTANPFNIVKTAKYIKKIRPDMVIIQWWHPYFAPCYWMLTRLYGNLKTVYVCHNVFPHERFPLDRFLTGLTLKTGKGFIVHAKEEKVQLNSVLNAEVLNEIAVAPHPTYNIFQHEYLSKIQARERLLLPQDSRILLFFGFVREYKGLKYLLNAMPELKETKLMVVGDFDGDKEIYTELVEKLGIGERVIIVDGYIPDKEVEKYFAACDIVILPYISATQSGIVQIAYGFYKPVIVTNVGGLPEVVKNGETGYVVESGNSHAIAQAVKRYFEEDREQEFKKNIEQEAYRFSWERMGEVVDDFFDS